MVLFDSHCHLYDDKYDGNTEIIVKNAQDNGVQYMVNIGTNKDTTKHALEQAQKYDNVYCAVGVYPEYCNDDEMDFSFIEELASTNSNKKVVAIGEIGLDFHSEVFNKENQKKHFIEQIEIANKLNLPICIHSRNADMEMLEVLKNHKVNRGFLMHCYCSSVEVAKEILKLGGYIALGGAVTFSNARGLLDVAKFVPLDRLMVETDSPYMCPEPLRGQRNEPANVRFTAQKIADLKEMSLEELAKATTENAIKFFGLNID